MCNFCSNFEANFVCVRDCARAFRVDKMKSER